MSRVSLPTFRRLARADFPLLGAWLAEPHVARWWNHDASAPAVEADFGGVVDGTDPADVFVVLDGDGRPAGLLQRYTFADHPGYAAELAHLLAVPPSALSIDYFVGEPRRLRRGFGAAMIRAALDGIWRDHPDAPCVIVPVSAANEASQRTLLRAGFAPAAAGELAPDNPVDGPAHVVYRIARPDGAGFARAGA